MRMVAGDVGFFMSSAQPFSRDDLALERVSLLHPGVELLQSLDRYVSSGWTRDPSALMRGRRSVIDRQLPVSPTARGRMASLQELGGG